MSHTEPDQHRGARYDGIAEWYDAQVGDAPHRHAVLRTHLPRGAGVCLDLGSGTGRDLAVLAEHGWTPVGLELSSDQLRLARSRATRLVQGDAEQLPFRTDSFAMVVSSWTSSDVDHFDRMLAETARVLHPRWPIPVLRRPSVLQRATRRVRRRRPTDRPPHVPVGDTAHVLALVGNRRHPHESGRNASRPPRGVPQRLRRRRPAIDPPE